ncbi:MAG: hypothetical protein A2156_01860 [Deltaproteobacteria bacterium RBG_16_48_10]|nr:MAG: hypothetical protein A2156_01860 [Deltaproteobacteria bacterium RBG_16_48_10]
MKDNLESSSADASANQLVAITIRLVPPDLKVREEAFYCLFKCDVMCSKFISFKVIFKVFGCEAVPVNHLKILSKQIWDVKQK